MRPQSLPLSTGLVLGMVGVVVTSGLHGVNRLTLQTPLLDADLENNLPTWFATLAFALAWLAAMTAVGASRGRRRAGWSLVALITLAFSVDEAASLHEVAGLRVGAETTLSLTQPAAAAAVVLLLLSVARVTRGAAGRTLVAATVTLALSQTVASVAGLYTQGAVLFLLEAVEDAGETLTAVLLMAAALQASGRSLDVRPRALQAELRQWWTGPVERRPEEPSSGERASMTQEPDAGLPTDRGSAGHDAPRGAVPHGLVDLRDDHECRGADADGAPTVPLPPARDGAPTELAADQRTLR